MERLQKNWLTEGLIDFEYKKYILLAYLKYVRQNFSDIKLYPFLSDLVFHYRNLQMVRDKKKVLDDQFPKLVSGVDLEKMQISYTKIVEDSELMSQIEAIASFAIDNISDCLHSGKEIYDFIEGHMVIEPVGLSPIYTREGYFFLCVNGKGEVHIYRYELPQFEDGSAGHMAISSEYIESSIRSLGHTFQHMKLDLIRNDKSMPNPATYLIITDIEVPLEETLLPVAKRMLIRLLSVA